MAHSQPETATVTDIPQIETKSNGHGSNRKYGRSLSMSQRIANRRNNCVKNPVSNPPAPQIVVKLPPMESNIDIYQILPETNQQLPLLTQKWLHSNLKSLNSKKKTKKKKIGSSPPTPPLPRNPHSKNNNENVRIPIYDLKTDLNIDRKNYEFTNFVCLLNIIIESCVKFEFLSKEFKNFISDYNIQQFRNKSFKMFKEECNVSKFHKSDKLNQLFLTLFDSPKFILENWNNFNNNSNNNNSNVTKKNICGLDAYLALYNDDRYITIHSFSNPASMDASVRNQAAAEFNSVKNSLDISRDKIALSIFYCTDFFDPHHYAWCYIVRFKKDGNKMPVLELEAEEIDKKQKRNVSAVEEEKEIMIDKRRRETIVIDDDEEEDGQDANDNNQHSDGLALDIDASKTSQNEQANENNLDIDNTFLENENSNDALLELTAFNNTDNEPDSMPLIFDIDDVNSNNMNSNIMNVPESQSQERISSQPRVAAAATPQTQEVEEDDVNEHNIENVDNIENGAHIQLSLAMNASHSEAQPLQIQNEPVIGQELQLHDLDATMMDDEDVECVGDNTQMNLSINSDAGLPQTILNDMQHHNHNHNYNQTLAATVINDEVDTFPETLMNDDENDIFMPDTLANTEVDESQNSLELDLTRSSLQRSDGIIIQTVIDDGGNGMDLDLEIKSIDAEQDNTMLQTERDNALMRRRLEILSSGSDGDESQDLTNNNSHGHSHSALQLEAETGDENEEKEEMEDGKAAILAQLTSMGFARDLIEWAIGDNTESNDVYSVLRYAENNKEFYETQVRNKKEEKKNMEEQSDLTDSSQQSKQSEQRRESGKKRKLKEMSSGSDGNYIISEDDEYGHDGIPPRKKQKFSQNKNKNKMLTRSAAKKRKENRNRNIESMYYDTDEADDGSEHSEEYESNYNKNKNRNKQKASKRQIRKKIKGKTAKKRKVKNVAKTKNVKATNSKMFANKKRRNLWFKDAFDFTDESEGDNLSSLWA